MVTPVTLGSCTVTFNLDEKRDIKSHQLEEYLDYSTRSRGQTFLMLQESQAYVRRLRRGRFAPALPFNL
jgi:lipase chaperone LimK